jgi:osmotically-inducible protein OsmY
MQSMDEISELSDNNKLLDSIRKKILNESHIKNCTISVFCDSESVIIQGSVGTYYQKQCAQEIVRMVFDNKVQLTIKNELRVS